VVEELDHFREGTSNQWLGRTPDGLHAHRPAAHLRQSRGRGSCWGTDGARRWPFGNEGGVPASAGTGRAGPRDNQILGSLCRRGAGKGRSGGRGHKDTNLRIKADASGSPRRIYESDRVDIEELYRGFREGERRQEVMRRLLRGGGVPSASGRPGPAPERVSHLPRRRIQSSALGRADALCRKIRLLSPSKDDVWGVRPRNKEQTFALDILLDDSVKLVTLRRERREPERHSGDRGRVTENLGRGECTSACSYTRPVFPMGKDLGFLPGDVEEKLKPWMAADFRTTWNTCSDSSRKKRQGGVRGVPGVDQPRDPRDRNPSPTIARPLHPEPVSIIRGRGAETCLRTR